MLFTLDNLIQHAFLFFVEVYVSSDVIVFELLQHQFLENLLQGNHSQALFILVVNDGCEVSFVRPEYINRLK